MRREETVCAVYTPAWGLRRGEQWEKWFSRRRVVQACPCCPQGRWWGPDVRDELFFFFKELGVNSERGRS